MVRRVRPKAKFGPAFFATDSSSSQPVQQLSSLATGQ